MLIILNVNLFSQEDIENWTEILQKFEKILKTSQVPQEDKAGEASVSQNAERFFIPSFKDDFHRELTLQILRFMKLFFDMCFNKSHYTSFEVRLRYFTIRFNTDIAISSLSANGRY